MKITVMLENKDILFNEVLPRMLEDEKWENDALLSVEIMPHAVLEGKKGYCTLCRRSAAGH